MFEGFFVISIDGVGREVIRESELPEYILENATDTGGETTQTEGGFVQITWQASREGHPSYDFAEMRSEGWWPMSQGEATVDELQVRESDLEAKCHKPAA